MANRSTAIWSAIVGVAVISVAAVLWSEDSTDYEPRSRSRGAKSPDKEGTGTESPSGYTPGYLTNVLCKAGWPKPTALEVERYTEENWEPPTEEWVKRNHSVVAKLCGLGKVPQAMTVLERRPECALLLAGAPDPGRLARVLARLDDRHYPVVEGWFKRYTAVEDMVLLVKALEDHERLLLDLWDKQLFGTEMLFMFPRDTKAAEDYDRWVTEVVSRHVLPRQQLEPDQAALLAFLICQGANIRERMATEPGFAHRFRETLWPRFEKLAAPDMWDAYAAMPGAWKILERADGVDLLAKYYQLPVLLLASKEEAYPESYHEFIVQAFKSNPEDLTLVMVLELCRRDADFLKLLDRRSTLTETAFREIVKKLAEVSGENPEDPKAVDARRERLRYVASLTNLAVEKEFGNRTDPFLVTLIPGYDVYALADKLLDGRDVAAEDVIAALVDGAALVPGGKAASTAASDQASRALTRSGLAVEKSTIKRISDRYSKQVVKNTKSQTTRAVLVSNALKAAVKTPLRELVRLTQSVDLTGLFRLITDQTGVGLRSVRHLFPWGAKFLVHEGGRVFVTVGQGKLGEFGNRIAQSIAQDTVRKLTSNKPQPGDVERAWRRNTYAWWAAQLIARP